MVQNTILPTATPAHVNPRGDVSSLSLRRNIIWTFVGNAVYAASQWGMISVLAKSGSPAMVGQFALGLALTSPVMIFSQLQLRAIQATDARHEYRFGDYLALRIVTTGVAFAIIVCITLFTGYAFETTAVILIIALAKAVEAMSDIFYGLFQKYERMDYIARSMMMKGPLALIALGIGVYWTGSVVWGGGSMLIVGIVILILYDIRNGRVIISRVESRSSSLPLGNGALDALCLRWNPQTLKNLTWLSFPLGLTMLFMSLNANIPRYFIKHYYGEYHLGIFAAIAYLVIAGNFVINAVAKSSNARLAKYYVIGNQKAFRKLLVKLTSLGCFLGIGMMIFVWTIGKKFLIIAYTAEYAGYVREFRLLMLATSLGYMFAFLGTAMTAARYFKIQLVISGTSVVAGIVLSYLLIPQYGLAGAAYVQFIAICAQGILSGSIVLYLLKHMNP